MAHYAFLDDNNIVTEVITGIDETQTIEGLDTETWYGNFRGQVCKRTSYNGNIRKNYAGIGFTYDAARDAFIAPKPFNSWTLDEATCRWQAPTPMPTDTDVGAPGTEILESVGTILVTFVKSMPATAADSSESVANPVAELANDARSLDLDISYFSPR